MSAVGGFAESNNCSRGRLACYRTGKDSKGMSCSRSADFGCAGGFKYGWVLWGLVG